MYPVGRYVVHKNSHFGKAYTLDDLGPPFVVETKPFEDVFQEQPSDVVEGLFQISLDDGTLFS